MFGLQALPVILLNRNATDSRFHNLGHAVDASGYDRSAIRQRLDQARSEGLAERWITRSVASAYRAANFS